MKTSFGLNHLHEQYPPDVLLRFAVLAEQVGFDSVWCSDCFHPWFDTGANAGFAWVWIAAAAERTRKVELGTAVTSPVQRYNPALIAQAFATLSVLYPDRISLGVGTGEPMHERPIGYNWPLPRERLERVEEAIIIMKKLWTESFVTFKGEYYTIKRAKLYTRPKTPIKLHLAATGRKAAEVAGKVADGIIVPNINPERIAERIIPSMQNGIQQSGRDEREFRKICHFAISYDEDYEKALNACRSWGGLAFPFIYRYGISDPREIETYARMLNDAELSKVFLIATDAEDCIRAFDEYIKLGFNCLNLSSSSPDQEKFIRTMGKEVIPNFKER